MNLAWNQYRPAAAERADWDDAATAVWKKARSKKREARSGDTVNKKSPANDITGTTGCGCLARLADIDWDPRADLRRTTQEKRKEPDVGEYQVRTITDPSKKLYLKPIDDPERRFVLVYWDGSVGTILGWAWAKDVMIDKWWHPKLKLHDGTIASAWLVPPSELEQFVPCERRDGSSGICRRDEVDGIIVSQTITPGGQLWTVEHRITFATIHALSTTKPEVEPDGLFD